MPELPRVSVVIPAYNTVDYVGECLDSVRSQRFTDVEILCIDDGSTDATRSVLQRHAAEDPRIRTLAFDHNRGPGAARNSGLDVARGEYVAFIDSDDLIHEDFIGTLLDVAHDSGADVVMCPLAKFRETEDGRKRFFGRCRYDRNIPTDLEGRSFTWGDIPDVFSLRFASCNKLYRKVFLEENDIRYAEGSFYEDLLFTFRCIFEADSLRFVRRALYQNRRERAGSTTFASGDRAIDAMTAMDDLQQYLATDQKYDGLRDRFAAFRFNKLVSYLPRNNADTFPDFYAALQQVAQDPRLEGNPWMTESQQVVRGEIQGRSWQEYLVMELWQARRSDRRWRLRRNQLRGRIERLERQNEQLNTRLQRFMADRERL